MNRVVLRMGIVTPAEAEGPGGSASSTLPPWIPAFARNEGL